MMSKTQMSDATHIVLTDRYASVDVKMLHNGGHRNLPL